MFASIVLREVVSESEIMTVLEDADIPGAVATKSRSAILAGAVWVDRAMTEGDVEQIIGSAKDLVESIAKVVVEAAGGTYASNADLPRLAKDALETLKMHPNAFQGRDPMKRLTAALAQVPSALAELRNHDGTGHGRSSITDLYEASAEFVGHVAVAWSKWVLAALGQLLAGMAEVHDAIQRIEQIRPDGGFRRGELRQLLEDLQLANLGSEQQHGLGVAVGRRSILGTVVADIDVVEPLAQGEESFPAPFAIGVIEGLFIGSKGYIRSTPGAPELAAAIAFRLGSQGYEALGGLAGTIEQADLSYAFDEDQSQMVVEELQQLAGQPGDAGAREALSRIAKRIEALEYVSS